MARTSKKKHKSSQNNKDTPKAHSNPVFYTEDRNSLKKVILSFNSISITVFFRFQAGFGTLLNELYKRFNVNSLVNIHYISRSSGETRISTTQDFRKFLYEEPDNSFLYVTSIPTSFSTEDETKSLKLTLTEESFRETSLTPQPKYNASNSGGKPNSKSPAPVAIQPVKSVQAPSSVPSAPSPINTPMSNKSRLITPNEIASPNKRPKVCETKPLTKNFASEINAVIKKFPGLFNQQYMDVLSNLFIDQALHEVNIDLPLLEKGLQKAAILIVPQDISDETSHPVIDLT